MGGRVHAFFSARRDDESGAILILSALFVIVMVLAAALAVDIGFLGVDKRNDHKMADLASLDAVRHLSDQQPCVDAAQTTYIQTVVDQSLQRNGYDTAAHGNTRNVQLGTVDQTTKVFSPSAACAAHAVQVTVGSVTKYELQPTSQSTHALAVSSQVGQGQFNIGSFLGTLNTNDATMLNKVLGKILKGSDLSLSLLSWQGLASGSVSLDAIKQQLAAGGMDVGTPDKLMNTQMTFAQFGMATAQALNNQGMVAQANAFNAVVAGATNNSTFTLGQIVQYSQGNGSAASLATTYENPFVLLTGAAMAANGSNFVSIPNLGVSIPNVGNLSVSLSAISKPADSGLVTPPSSLTTKQLNMTVTPTLNAPVTIAGLLGASVTGNLPITVQGGGATGTLTHADCPDAASASMTVHVQPQAVNTTSSSTLAVNATVLGINTTVANVALAANQVTNGTPTDLSFAHPSEFMPPDGSAGTKRAGSTTLGLTGGSGGSYSVSNVSLIGTPPLITTSLASSSTLGAIDPIVQAVDSQVISRLARLLGISLGGADVGAEQLKCSGIALIS
ncbi:MAG: hypothetical protein JO148_01275 [Acidimicrobiia bacterium]|nr:hypothetical protein [Acidimicrobiia bacterium]